MSQDRQKEQFGYWPALENPNAIAKRHAASREAEARTRLSQLEIEIGSGQGENNNSKLSDTNIEAEAILSKAEEAILTPETSGSVEDSLTWIQTVRERIKKLGR